MTQKKKLSSYQKLKNQVEWLLESNKALVNENVNNGDHLANQPFIPEYLNFEETELEDKTTLVTFQRIYSKDGYSMIRVNDNWWVINTPKKTQNTVRIDSMLDGINALKLSGMEITPRSVMSEEIVLNQVKKQYEENMSKMEQEFAFQKKIE
jgi:hypothetical protein